MKCIFNGLQDFDYHQRKVWNMLRHNMWEGEVPVGLTAPDKIVEMKPDTFNRSISCRKTSKTRSQKTKR